MIRSTCGIGAVFSVLLLGVLLSNGASGLKAAGDVDTNDDFADVDTDVVEPEIDEEEILTTEPASSNKKPRKKNTKRQSRSSKSTTDAQAPQATAESPSSEAESAVELFYLNVIGSVLALLYVLNYFRGSSKNGHTAQAWYDECKDLMTESFAEVGLQKEALIMESANEYVLYGTGRKNCRSMCAKLTLPMHHDLVTVVQTFSLPPKSDEIHITFELKQELVQGFVFAIVRTKQAKRIKEDYADLDQLAKTYKGSHWNLPAEFSVFTDCPDVVPLILTTELKEFFANFKDELQSLHYSDFFMGKRVVDPLDPTVEVATKDPTKAKPNLTMHFKVASSGQENSLEQKKLVMNGAIGFLDAVTGASLSEQVKKQLEKKRADYKEKFYRKDPQEIKQEAIDKRRDEERKEKERYDAMEADHPSRIAYEKKMEKKNQRKEKSKNAKRGMMRR
eukprot:m.126577 g.126577  ORF g.126577 m.126577 type:complete len:448 (+) comp29210_c0_seq1:71-1414(+)